jgi:hypothetical protein
MCPDETGTDQARTPAGWQCEAQNLSASDRIVSAMGQTFSPPREIASLDMSDRGHGWVWLTVAKRPQDRSRRRERRMFRLGVYELVTVADNARCEPRGQMSRSPADRGEGK